MPHDYSNAGGALISIIGSGRVGAAIAFLCAAKAIDDITLVNIARDKAVGEALDIASAVPADSGYSIRGTDDHSEMAGSEIIVITASTAVYQTDRAENIAGQAQMIRDIAGRVRRFCPDSIVLVVSNPLDVLTYCFQRESGMSRFRVIGIASSLDSARFRYCLSDRTGVPYRDLRDVLVLGEHGDSMVPIFSRVRAGGSALGMSDDQRAAIAADVRDYWRSLRAFKSRSQFGIAKNTCDVIESVKNSEPLDIPASFVLDGEYGQRDVAMGVPVRIDGTGICDVPAIELDDAEAEALAASAEKIRGQIQSVLD